MNLNDAKELLNLTKLANLQICVCVLDRDQHESEALLKALKIEGYGAYVRMTELGEEVVIIDKIGEKDGNS